MGHDSLYFVVLGGLGTEDTCRDFFLSVLKEDWFFNDSEDILRDLGALKGNLLLILQLFVLFFGDVLGDWHGEEVSLAE